MQVVRNHDGDIDVATSDLTFSLFLTFPFTIVQLSFISYPHIRQSAGSLEASVLHTHSRMSR